MHHVMHYAMLAGGLRRALNTWHAAFAQGRARRAAIVPLVRRAAF